MTRCKVHISGVKLLTKRIVNTIRTYFHDFWSMLTGNKNHEQELQDCYNSRLSNKFFGLKRTKSIKKTRRMSDHIHIKFTKLHKHVRKVINNDYCPKMKSHRISHFGKSIF
jgi:hypothetical protein